MELKSVSRYIATNYTVTHSKCLGIELLSWQFIPEHYIQLLREIQIKLENGINIRKFAIKCHYFDENGI